MSNMQSPKWYRSLYWRVGVALFALVALMLVAEGALFLWLSDRTAGAMPARNPGQMARLVASDLGVALSNDPKLDVQRYLREQYGHFFQTLIVLMRGGPVVANHDDVERELLETVRSVSEQRLLQQRFGRRGGRGQAGGSGRGAGERGRPMPGDRPDDRDRPPPEGRLESREPPPLDDRPEVRTRRAQPLRGGLELAGIVVGGMRIGTVVLVLDNPPFTRIVRLVGPTMGLVAGGVLIVGGSLIALVLFGPARRRLRQVQEATERLGSGDLRARAPEDGGDEVSAVARSFNRMADELTQRAEALESSDKARRQLLADVSHELMTPLTAMRGYIETLGMPELQIDPPTRERYMRIVTEETHRLEHIIGDLLDLARLEGGGTTMRRERVSLEVLFDRVAERHERELDARSIVLVRSLEPGAEQVIGDSDRLEQALQNLVANALRFTPDEGQISLTTRRVKEAVHIIVKDTGPGIPAPQLPLIFDRFYKVDAARRQAGGSGLGLSIVRAIIERHGGTIVARNDGGAVFEITLKGEK